MQNPAESTGLCNGLPLPGVNQKLISRTLPIGNLPITLRSFNPDTDINTLYKWMSLEFEGPLKTKATPPRGLLDSYSCMMESDFARPFMGLVNDIPVCQLNVFKASQDILSLRYNSRPGDYGLQMVTAPLCVSDNLTALLRASVEYFFSFRDTVRIVTEIDVRNEWHFNMFRKIGFRMSTKLATTYRTAHLYACTRDSLKRSAGRSSLFLR